MIFRDLLMPVMNRFPVSRGPGAEGRPTLASISIVVISTNSNVERSGCFRHPTCLRTGIGSVVDAEKESERA
jgi:hypothetical protein